MYCSLDNQRDCALVDPKVFFLFVVAQEQKVARNVIYGKDYACTYLLLTLMYR
jgi:hypothetical protein